MTVAVCIHCGAYKHGAFTPCPSCKKGPDGDDEVCKSMILTDWFQSEKDLEAISTGIKMGLPVDYPPEALERVRGTIKKLDKFLKAGS